MKLKPATGQFSGSFTHPCAEQDHQLQGTGPAVRRYLGRVFPGRRRERLRDLRADAVTATNCIDDRELEKLARCVRFVLIWTMATTHCDCESGQKRERSARQH